MADSIGTKRSWTQWAKERDQALRDPYGWLSLVELKWLTEVPTKLEHFPGLWSADGLMVTFAPVPGEPKVFRDGQEITEPLEIEVVKGSSDRSLRDEREREVEIAYRFWGPCVRIRDPKAKRLAEFRGIPRFDFDPAWVLRGRITALEEPQEITVGAAIEGGSHVIKAWAEAHVSSPGNGEIKLLVSGEGPSNASILFYDETNGDTTPGWRTVPVFVDGETVLVDFNRSQIFPAHLSPYGTCPKAPEQNRIHRKVQAGEQSFPGRETEGSI